MQLLKAEYRSLVVQFWVTVKSLVIFSWDSQPTCVWSPCFIASVSISACRGFPTGDDGIRTHDPLLAGQVLSQLSYTPIKVCSSISPTPFYRKFLWLAFFSKKVTYSEPRADFSALTLCWHRAIVPCRFQQSIFATAELNFCVRNGNRWTLCVITPT